MDISKDIYRSSLSLLTDLYQITMAYGYWKNDRHEDEAVFHLFYRKNPFGGGYAIAAGLQAAIDYLNDLKPAKDDLEYLESLKGNDGRPLFEKAFLEFLGNMEFACEVDAVEEGTIVFPHEPIMRIRGPLYQCQLVETTLLNMINFQTLIATKASRVCYAAQGDPVLEFGLRRAQGIDGGLSAARAAYIGGAVGTSNVLAGKLFGIPVKGTHAHSWVMSYDTEMESFEAYARALPNNSIFLVDTYDTVEGVRNAIKVGLELREKGYEMGGIRLDSGDLAKLSIAARDLLDKAGFPEAKIVASNNLDEYTISELKSQGCKVQVWGVGTKLATSYEQPALGGVYKLAAIKEKGESWEYRIKLSENPIKTSNPGIQQVRRFFLEDKMVKDLIYDSGPEGTGKPNPISIPRHDSYEDLLRPIFQNGKLVYKSPEIRMIREKALACLSRLPSSIRKLKTEIEYPASLDQTLLTIKSELIGKVKIA